MPKQNMPFENKQPDDVNNNNGPLYWRKWYVGVVVFLAVQIILYYLITAHFK